MKHLILLSLLTLTSSLLTLSAAVPLRWTVETSRAVPAQFEAYQGETLELEAALLSYGKPLEAPSNYSLYWQTNGMGSTYWSVPCPSSATTTNVLFAKWSPTNDVGAKVYNCFIGQPGTIYHAAFQLRLRPSPGATPNELPLPQKVIDFAKVTVLNPPWSGGVDTNAVREIVRPMIGEATNALDKAKRDYADLTYNTQTPDEDVIWHVSDAGTLFPDFKWKPSTGRWVCWYRYYDPADPVPEWNDGEYIERTAVGFQLITEYPSFAWGNSFNPGAVVSDQSPDIVAEITSNGTMANDTLALVSQVPTDAEKAAWNAKLDATNGFHGVGMGGDKWGIFFRDGAGVHDDLIRFDYSNLMEDNYHLIFGNEEFDSTSYFHGRSTMATFSDLAYILYSHDFMHSIVFNEGYSRWVADENPIAYLSDIEPPGNYSSVSNAAMWASNEVANIHIDATDPTFSNAVLAVGIDTNTVAQIGELKQFFDDLPTGTVGTSLGGIILALLGSAAYLKKKTALLETDGAASDTFATDLLGKQVANVKANTVSLAAAYIETATYAVGDAVTHDGKLYKCAEAITTAEAWTPAHWTETTVATLWNNADTTSYGGQN